MVVVGEGALIAALSRSRDRHHALGRRHHPEGAGRRDPGAAHAASPRSPAAPAPARPWWRCTVPPILLYTDRRRFEGGGVLVVGPNAVFMSYIERVLPSLGETSVSLRALGEVVDGVTATRHDRPVVAAIKGAARMRTDPAAHGARSGARSADGVPHLLPRRRADARPIAQLRGLRRHLLSSGQRRNQVVPKVADELIDALWQQGRRASGRSSAARTSSRTRCAATAQFTDFVAGLVAGRGRRRRARLVGRPRACSRGTPASC